MKLSLLTLLCALSVLVTTRPTYAQNMTTTSSGPQKATFGGGCFWCTEAIFLGLKGVSKVQSGYAGGTVKNPTYREVCTGTTGHAEVTQITYDPAVVSYEDLLEVFGILMIQLP